MPYSYRNTPVLQKISRGWTQMNAIRGVNCVSTRQSELVTV